jgi:hypothetical protein
LILAKPRLEVRTHGVAINILGHGVNNEIGTVVQWVLDVGAHKSVIDNDLNTVLVGNVGNSPDIHQAESRVGGGLDPDELGLGADQLLHVQLNGGGEGDLDTVRRSNLGEVSVGTAVNIGDRNDMGASSKGLENVGRSGGAGGEGQSVLGMLESCNGLLKVITARGISPPDRCVKLRD